MRLLVYGFGYTGRALGRRLIPRGWTLAGTSRSQAGRAEMAALGVEPLDPADPLALAQAVRAVDALLIAAPPHEGGCPGLAALAPPLAAGAARPPWIGYLSTTGVYGDRGGGWVLEDSALRPASPEGARRVAAEAAWAALARELGLHATALRLPGIYGPGRSPLDRVRAGDAHRLRRPGHVFSRIHVDDIASGVQAAIARPSLHASYNLCDDEPAEPSEVTAWAAGLLGRAPPPEQAFDAGALTPLARRFWAECKRVSNARAKAALGWRPTYPGYREGLAAVLAAERGER